MNAMCTTRDETKDVRNHTYNTFDALVRPAIEQQAQAVGGSMDGSPHQRGGYTALT
jgi:hypothetical protein